MNKCVGCCTGVQSETAICVCGQRQVPTKKRTYRLLCPRARADRRIIGLCASLHYPCAGLSVDVQGCERNTEMMTCQAGRQREILD